LEASSRGGTAQFAKVQPKLKDDQFDKVAEAAEAEAWSLFTNRRPAAAKRNNTVQKVRNATYDASLTPLERMKQALSLGADKPVERPKTVPVQAAGEVTANGQKIDHRAPASKSDTPTQKPLISGASKSGRAPAKTDEAANTDAAVRAPRNREVMLIKNMKSTGDEGPDAVACVTHCRYGKEVRHTWRKCIERCIEQPIFHDTFMKMLAEEYHPAKSLGEAVPAGLELPSAEHLRRIQKAINKRKHHAEL